jgi:hypothetical protein
MVDFKNRLAKHSAERPIDPIQIYDRLDRASDKGPLRPAQKAILDTWHTSQRTRRDLILKLHTGQENPSRVVDAPVLLARGGEASALRLPE